MENKETIEVKEINISENIAQPDLKAIEKKPKSSKKKVILISALIAAIVVIMGIIVSVIVFTGNSNSLWKKPVDEEGIGIYRYNVTPEEFIDKANELCNYDNEYHEFEYAEKTAIRDDNESAERYWYDISSFKINPGDEPINSFKVNPGDEPINWGYYSQCGVDYCEDKTISKTSLVFPYNDVWSFDFAYSDLCISTVQILYAYNAFESDSADDVLNALKSFSDKLEKMAQNHRIQIYFKYGDFVLYLFEDENSEVLYWLIQKTDEKGIEYMEKELGYIMINLADRMSLNDYNEVTKKGN